MYEKLGPGLFIQSKTKAVKNKWHKPIILYPNKIVITAVNNSSPRKYRLSIHRLRFSIFPHDRARKSFLHQRNSTQINKSKSASKNFRGTF